MIDKTPYPDPQADLLSKEAISPYREMVAYEVLWGNLKHTLKSIAELFKANEVLPSQLLARQRGLFPDDGLEAKVVKFLSGKSGFSVTVHGSFQYPPSLRDAVYPIELFYHRGAIGLTESRCVSIVGTRECTEDGKKRAARIARELVRHDFTVVSGLARGIDTAAMREVLRVSGRLIGVIGTPIDRRYPEENEDLHQEIERNHLLISQVPFYRHDIEHFKARRRYFPERNQTMSALSEATVIVEASDRSGTLTQARACIEQGRKLFILDSCFRNTSITWPAHYLKLGAIRVKDVSDILKALNGQAK